eukprot:4812304-Pyramimonas_sp.AAC.1
MKRLTTVKQNAEAPDCMTRRRRKRRKRGSCLQLREKLIDRCGPTLRGSLRFLREAHCLGEPSTLQSTDFARHESLQFAILVYSAV